MCEAECGRWQDPFFFFVLYRVFVNISFVDWEGMGLSPDRVELAEQPNGQPLIFSVAALLTSQLLAGDARRVATRW